MITGKSLSILINATKKHWVKLKQHIVKSDEKTEKKAKNKNMSFESKLENHALQYEFCYAELSTKGFLFFLHTAKLLQIITAWIAIQR